METTTGVQGLRLGHGLVLLDTPGLHSVTPENAQMTHDFLECADAVLWLTSSTSPGQVQELDGLGGKLHRQKPLLPIITRSDVLEEDEISGTIVKVLRNKSIANRQRQQANVFQRSGEKLRQMGVNPAQLRSPVSVSVHTAIRAEVTAGDLAQNGFDDLYAALIDIVADAQAYKHRKASEVLLHQLEECVVGGLDSHVLVALHRVTRLMSEERERGGGSTGD